MGHYAPDGKRILFASSRGQNSDNPVEVADLYVMDADGSNVRRLTYTTDKGESSDGGWSPDGRKIAFRAGSPAKTQTGDQNRITLPSGDVSTQWWNSQEVYLMDADGSNVQRLTFNDAFDGHIYWQPARR